MRDRTFGIVGGGLVGLATALKLRERFPEAQIRLWEKEPRAGQHQSTHNSGVLHAGLYYAPGSLKAQLAVRGIRALTAFCREEGVAHEICGKVVVAVDESEIPRLRILLERGLANGLQNVRWLSAAELREIEPHASGVAAVHVPEEGIVDYGTVVNTIAHRLTASDVDLQLGSPVTRLQRSDGGWTVKTADTEMRCGFLVNCAGLQCDRIAKLAGERPAARIVPFRGEYYRLRPERSALVRHLIYPVPDPTYPFLGVHFTRLIGGGVEAGPNAVLALAREGYTSTAWSWRDTAASLGFPGLWRFLWRHRGMCGAELYRSMSRKSFCASLQRLVPELCEEDLVPGGAGVRAQTMTHQGDLVQDFHLIERPDAVHVLNAPSPAATACLAIGEYIARAVAART